MSWKKKESSFPLLLIITAQLTCKKKRFNSIFKNVQPEKSVFFFHKIQYLCLVNPPIAKLNHGNITVVGHDWRIHAQLCLCVSDVMHHCYWSRLHAGRQVSPSEIHPPKKDKRAKTRSWGQTGLWSLPASSKSNDVTLSGSGSFKTHAILIEYWVWLEYVTGLTEAIGAYQTLFYSYDLSCCFFY